MLRQARAQQSPWYPAQAGQVAVRGCGTTLGLRMGVASGTQQRALVDEMQNSFPLLCVRPHAAAVALGMLGADLQTAPGTGCLPGTAPGEADGFPLPGPSLLFPMQPPPGSIRGQPPGCGVLLWELGTALGEGSGGLQGRGTRKRSQEPLLCSTPPALLTDAPKLTPGSCGHVLQGGISCTSAPGGRFLGRDVPCTRLAEGSF